jgi:hypothetical protein
VTLNACGNGGDGGIGEQFILNETLVMGGNGGDGGSGGGILNASSNALANIADSLIAMNVFGNGGVGGLAVINPNVTILAVAQVGESGAGGSGFDVAGNFGSQGFNLISTSEGSIGFTNGVHADQVGSVASPIDPRIGPLQMRGGPTPTHALLPGSPAIDKGNSFGNKTDQRGFVRPFQFPISDAPSGDGSDIGAFELRGGQF